VDRVGDDGRSRKGDLFFHFFSCNPLKSHETAKYKFGKAWKNLASAAINLAKQTNCLAMQIFDADGRHQEPRHSERL
jgi:hypothetical protein